MITGEGVDEVVREWAKSFPKFPRPRIWIGVVVVEDDIMGAEVEKGRFGGATPLIWRVVLEFRKDAD